MTEKEKTLDLATLEHLKIVNEFYSDCSAKVNGHYYICRMINELKKSKASDELIVIPLSNMNSNNINADPDCPICHGTGEYHTGGSFGGPVVYNRCHCTNRSWEL